MSYIVKVLNGTQYTWLDDLSTHVGPGEGWNADGRTLGNAYLKSSELGALNFLDIGDTHIPGDSGETWGVLLSYQGEEVVGRYEGGGALSVTLNAFGQAELSGMDLRQIQLPSFNLTLS